MSQFTLFCYPHLHLWAIVFFFGTQRRRSHFFLSPSSPLFSLLALLSCHVSSIERLSLHCSSNWKNYGFDQLVSQRNWHHLLDEKLRFWGTRLPWRNVCSWLHDGRVERVAYRVFSGSFRGGHWRYLPIRNHDNRSFADRIRLCPGLSKNSENGEQLSKASQGCPSWLKQWEERSALRLRLLTAIWILSWRSSLLCKGKSISETRMDKESSRGIGMRLLAPRLNNRNLIFSTPPNQHWPRPRPLLENQPWEEHCSVTLLRSSPILQTPADYKLLHIHTQTTHTHTYTHIHTFIHLPTPDPSPPSLWTASLTSGSVTSAGKWLQVWMAACQSWITSPVAKSCVYGVLCAFVAEVFFLFSHCTPQGA